MQQRHLSMHSSPVVLITATACSMASVQFIFVQLSSFVTPAHASLLRSGSNTRLWQQFEMSCTGYWCNSDLITIYATSFTSAFITVHHRTSMCIHFGEIEDRRHLRLAGCGNLVVPAQPVKHTDHAVSLSGSSVWNSLPLTVIDLELTLLAFNKLLKTKLFR